MSDDIRIDTYTAHWDAAMRPAAPEIGTLVLWAWEPADGREVAAFERCLEAAGRTVRFVDPADESGFDLYEVVPR
jgi:hypothetical protein